MRSPREIISRKDPSPARNKNGYRYRDGNERRRGRRENEKETSKKIEKDEERKREISTFSQYTLHDILVASSRRVSILISEILNAPISRRKRRMYTHTYFLSLLLFFLFLSFADHDVPGCTCVCVCLRLRQSQCSIVRRCIILLGAKGDDFITDPGNHSPKLTLFSVSTVLVLPQLARAQFYLSRFPGEKREKGRRRKKEKH